MRNAKVGIFFVASTILLASCSSTISQFSADGGAATFSWLLPRTVLDVTATYTFDSCTDGKGGAELKFNASSTFATRTVPDLALGPNFPDGRVGVDLGKLVSWTSDSTAKFDTYPDGTLQSLGSATTDQTQAILSNVFTGVTKLASFASFGVSDLQMGPKSRQNFCGDADKVLASIRSKEGALKRLRLIPGKAAELKIAALSQEITQLRKAITVEEKGSLDFKLGDNLDKGVAQLILRPDPEKLIAANWIAKGVGKDQSGMNESNSVHVYISDDDASVSGYELRVQPLPEGTLYRAPAIFNVEIYNAKKLGRADDKNNLLDKRPIAFAQFGTPQRLPLEAGLFENFDWSLSFASDGRISKANFSTKAKGVPASKVFSDASTAAAGIAETLTKADPELASMKAGNERIKAEIDRIKLQKELETLLMQGGL